MTAPPKNYLLLVQTAKINYDPKYKTPYYIRHIKLTYFISRDAAINTMGSHGNLVFMLLWKCSFLKELILELFT